MYYIDRHFYSSQIRLVTRDKLVLCVLFVNLTASTYIVSLTHWPLGDFNESFEKQF